MSQNWSLHVQQHKDTKGAHLTTKDHETTIEWSFQGLNLCLLRRRIFLCQNLRILWFPNLQFSPLLLQRKKRDQYWEIPWFLLHRVKLVRDETEVQNFAQRHWAMAHHITKESIYLLWPSIHIMKFQWNTSHPSIFIIIWLYSTNLIEPYLSQA